MEENWSLNVGKFEWDKSDEEIRYSYCFTTENSLSYEAFNAIILTVTANGRQALAGLEGADRRVTAGVSGSCQRLAEPEIWKTRRVSSLNRRICTASVKRPSS